MRSFSTGWTEKVLFFIFLRVFLFRLPHLYTYIHQFISSGLCFYVLSLSRIEMDYTSNEILILNTLHCVQEVLFFFLRLPISFFFMLPSPILVLLLLADNSFLFFLFYSCFCCNFVYFCVTHFVKHCFHDPKVFLTNCIKFDL